MILCGGRGTRLQERTQLLPKPLVEIGGRPIVWHVIQIYLAQGFTRFLLLTGYRRDQIEEFVAGESWPEGVEIRCLPTGDETPTGGRVHLGARALEDELCCVTYADGVADVEEPPRVGGCQQNVRAGRIERLRETREGGVGLG